MTQTTIFTPDEIATLEALYPDRDGWFAYFWILSDRVQEESDEMAEGMRFLCAIDARPVQSARKSYWFCEAKSKGYAIKLRGDEGLRFQNYIPEEAGDEGSRIYPSLSASVEAFLLKWASLSADVRARLWREWVQS